MSLTIIAFATILIAGLADLACLWLLVRTGRVYWAVIVLPAALILDVVAFASGIRTPAVTSALLIPICASLGALVGWRIRERSTLIVALLSAAAADLVSSLAAGGLTRRIVEDAARGGRLLEYMTVSVPYAGGVLHVIGFGDLVVLAIVILGLRNQGVGWLPAFAVPFAGFLLALIFGLFIGWGVPGLPFLAATTLAFLYTSVAG